RLRQGRPQAVPLGPGAWECPPCWPVPPGVWGSPPSGTGCRPRGRSRSATVGAELRGPDLGAAAGAELLGGRRGEGGAALLAELADGDRRAALAAAHLAPCGGGGRDLGGGLLGLDVRRGELGSGGAGLALHGAHHAHAHGDLGAEQGGAALAPAL